MSKAEKYIEENTRTKVNHITENFPWITTTEARMAVKIAREEIYEWLDSHSERYVYWMDEEFGKEDLINDLKQAIKDE